MWLQGVDQCHIDGNSPVEITVFFVCYVHYEEEELGAKKTKR